MRTPLGSLQKRPIDFSSIGLFCEEEILPLTYENIDVDLRLSDQSWGAAICGKHSEGVAVGVFSVQHVVEENLHREWAGL